ncbi:hypothetical protein [Nocardia cyriacigeorgica]|uniref:hypothetical protein n=1 Tax=Nocardia cyriacigeorgica TaxID=135487 RepID=UPI002457E5C7|nr:hypothetical protein [Nocardia cyriacigeorgica]
MIEHLLPDIDDIETRIVGHWVEQHAEGRLDTVELSAHTSEGYELRLQVRIPARIHDHALHVFIHGQAKREKYTPPVFYRRGSSRRVGAVCVFLCDPILLYSQDCSIGWHLLGDEALWPFVRGLIQNLSAAHLSRGVVWHGSSAGAYAAIRNTLRWSGPALAIAVAPQNDPTEFFYWPEFASYASLPRTAVPEPLHVLLDRQGLHDDSMVHIMVNDKDTYHLLAHIRPLLPFADSYRQFAIRMIHNDMGHERIGEADYWANYALAERRWREHQP